MYSLNLNADNRILSACICLEGFEYMNVVDALPDGSISDYRYADGEYVYDPLPKPEPQPEEPTTNDILDALLGIGGNANGQITSGRTIQKGIADVCSNSHRRTSNGNSNGISSL